MGGNPRAMRPHVMRPSPLAQVSHQRALSSVSMASDLAHNPLFWKQFSITNRTELADPENGWSTSSHSDSSVLSRKKTDGDEWLAQQHREKRRCRLTALFITGILITVITCASIVGWHFTTGRRKLMGRSMR
ncbi:BgTH12-05697 [Blumeria graminis f. sp. triticale]|uniref:Uncharacterized protein n=4 Tax=Blumeria graminis TaxID=34373 RepID=A0A656KKP9_BLUGR|nr:hypothetical protein BGT96224_4048 [Blumeria graminis f. sp. tritici 96224]CAD6503954.1 BgTH12-05697 [Blumeria graminis f. sp. triticale]VDB90678.1 Bgt-4048 [Blumeria graminis f. sp. tritici]